MFYMAVITDLLLNKAVLSNFSV